MTSSTAASPPCTSSGMSGGSQHGFPEAQFPLQEQVENFMEAQRVSRRQETAAAVKLRRDLSAALAVPEDCLLGRVPGILKVVDDHVLFPFSPFWSKYGKRWIRVSRFESLERVCYRFRGVLQERVIMMHIMPYLSPLDAHKIHLMVDNPGRIENPRDFILVDDGGEEGQNLPVRGRSGVLMLQDPDAPNDESAVIHLKFIVLNYGLLWVKASEYSHFIGSMAPAKALTSQVDHYLFQITEDPATANAAHGADPDHIGNLEEACEQSKHELLLSLRNDGLDPHDTILAIDAELHEELYDIGYNPCYPNDRTETEMEDLTKHAIETYMIQLENKNPHDLRSAREARWNVLIAEGLYDVAARRSESIKQCWNAIQVCKEQLVDAVNKMEIAASRPLLIGVIGRDERVM